LLCPKCNCDHAHRSHRVGLRERIYSAWRGRPYRCHGCGFRFFAHDETPSTRAESGEPDATAKKPRGNSHDEKAKARHRTERLRLRREVLLYGIALLLFLAFLYFLTRDRGPGASPE
jgi:hypothetical protein